MARNLRPSWTTPGYENMDYGSLQNAQNQYDLLIAQEKANELKQQEMKNQKEIQEKQLQHEADMREQDRQAQKDIMLSQIELEKAREVRRAVERKIQLCDEHDVDYNDIEKFVCILNLGDQSTIYKLQEELDQHKIYEQQKERIDELNEQINDLKLRKAMKQPTNIKEFSLTQLVCYILIFFGLVLGVPGILMNGVMDPTPLVIIDITICIALYLIGKVSQANETRKTNNRLKNESKDLDKEIQEYEAQKHIEHLPENIDELILANEQKLIDLGNKSTEEAEVKKQKFNEFRKTHYNNEMEKLFRKLEIEGLETIREKDATKKGTKKDYIRYIEQYL